MGSRRLTRRSHVSVGRAGRAARIGGTYWATWWCR